MGKALILARVSTEMQSLDSQICRLIDEAKRLGYAEQDITVVSGKESGVKFDYEERETLKTLEQHIETGQYDMVFVWEVSRIARRQKVLHEVRDYLIRKDVNLYCMNPNFIMLKDDKTIDPTASIVFSIFGTMAEEEARLTKERMKRGIVHAKTLGRHAGGRVMFGYVTNKNHEYEIDAAQATIVKRIFNEYVNGNKSMKSLTRDLQEEGHFKNIQFLTAVQEVYNILHRDCYCGRKKGMPAIISEDLYDRSVEKRKTSELKVNHTDNMALCKGILRDANTGLLLSSNTATGMYYSKRKSGVAVGMHIIEPVIWDIAVELHKKLSNVNVKDVLDRLNRMIQTNERKLYNISESLYDIEKKIDKIEERIIIGRISEAKAEELETKLEDEAKELKKRRHEIEKDNERIRAEGNKIYDASEVSIDYDNLSKKERYDVVHAVISKVILSRESRYMLRCETYDYAGNIINKTTIDTYKKKVVLVE